MEKVVEKVIWRDLDKKDVEQWIELLHDAHRENLKSGIPFTAGTLSVEEGLEILDEYYVFGGFIENRLITTLTIGEHPDNKDWKYFNLLAVASDLQGEGIGNLTLKVGEEISKEKGATQIHFDTSEAHPWLASYYERSGYERDGFIQWEGKPYRSVKLFKKLYA